MLKIDFNDDWYFKKDAGGMFGGTEKAEKIILPHDAMILEPRRAENASGNSGGFYPGENYVYEKQFYAGEELLGKQIFLNFEGVYHQAKVYVNGEYICGNLYGYTEFSADLTDAMKIGQENQIQVQVKNNDAPSGRWYTGGGIYRPVHLLIGGESLIEQDSLQITTIEAAEDISSVEVRMKIKYSGIGKKKVYLKTEISEIESGKVVCKESTPVTLYTEESPVVRQRLYIQQAQLWSPESPKLYRCIVKMAENVQEEGETQDFLDEAEETFGIRHIQIDPLYGLRINGERILLRGSCIHHDNGIVGAATFAEAEERRVRLSKEAGFNAFRIAHNPASRAFLEACDKYGMLVMEETFDMWNHSKLPNDYARDFEVDWEKSAEAVVKKDYNHPSVIMYSIGNEIQEIGTSAGARWNRKIAEKFRELDATRFITNGMNGLLTVMDEMGMILKDLGLIPENSEELKAEGDVNDLMTAAMDNTGEMIRHPLIGERIEESCGGLDISGYNYMTGRYEGDTKTYPNRLIVGSETYPPQIAENWKEIKKRPAVLGDFTWTGYDYIGEAGIGVSSYNGAGGFFSEYPCYLANVGDIDLIGYRRPMSYYREIVWGLRKQPYLAVQSPEHYGEHCSLTPWITEPVDETWTWTGMEGKRCKVEVYSGDEEVELLVNGQSYGKLPTGEKNAFKAVFDVVYHPGTITAVAYTDGKENGRYELATVKENTKICVQSEKEVLSSKKRELTFVMISAQDDQNVLDYHSNKKVKVEVTGAGVLQGLGSADPFSEENFYDTERTLYRGMLLATIRAGKDSGEICLKVTAEGEEPVVQKILVK